MAATPIGFLGWMALAGVLLLVMALSSGHVRRMPVSPALIYLVVGAILGPLGLRWLRLELLKLPGLVERGVTEVAVIVAPFVGGLKLRLPLRGAAWHAAYRLAGPVMSFSIAGVALVAYVLFAVEGAVCLLIGAVLAPTDPVLASNVAVSDSRDHDRLRYGLSGEAGLNDGMAFPFVVFALTWLTMGHVGSWVGSWAIERLIWGVPATSTNAGLSAKPPGRVDVREREASCAWSETALTGVLVLRQ